MNKKKFQFCYGKAAGQGYESSTKNTCAMLIDRRRETYKGYNLITKNSMKKIFLFALTMFVSVVYTWSQEISNISFEVVQTDVSAYLNPKMDNNNKACALVKVNYYRPGVRFEGNVIGTPEFKNSQYFVYVTPGTNYLNIIVPEHRPRMIKFSDYGYNGLESKMTYKLCFDPDKSVKDLPNPNIIFNKALREPKEYTLSISRNGETIYFTTDDWNNLSNIEKQKLSIDGLVIPNSNSHDAFLLTLNDADNYEIEWQVAKNKYGDNLPTNSMVEFFCWHFDDINNRLMSFGFPELIPGQYHTRTATYYVNDGIVWGPFTRPQEKGRVRLIKFIKSGDTTIKSLDTPPAWWEKATVWPLPFSLQTKWTDEIRYVQIEDYLQDATTPVFGVVLMKGAKCFVVELQDVPGTYDAGQVPKYAEYLPDYEEGEMLSLNMIKLNQIFEQVNGAQPLVVDENDNPYYWTIAIDDGYMLWTAAEDGEPMLYKSLYQSDLGEDDICRIRKIHRLK